MNNSERVNNNWSLTQSQREYLERIPEDAMADIEPWDSAAAEYAKNLVSELNNDNLEVIWEGSLSLGIPGQNDIDLLLLADPGEFEKLLPDITKVLGKPTYVFDDKILWRIHQSGHKIDAFLGSKNSENVKKDIIFVQALKDNPAFLNEYRELKTGDLSAREYYRLKNEFYNKVTRSF